MNNNDNNGNSYHNNNDNEHNLAPLLLLHLKQYTNMHVQKMELDIRK